MTDENSRSEQVVTAFKQHKLAISALRRIRQLLHEFERERIIDRRFAWYGVAIIIVLLALVALHRLGVDRVVVS